MPYLPLSIDTGDSRIDDVFREVIEAQLEEAHWLLAAARPEECRSPSFPMGAAMLLLGTIAACSTLESLNKPGHKRKTDRKDFIGWIAAYFPWDQVSLDSVLKVLESEESVVILWCRARDSRTRPRCGRTIVAQPTSARTADTRVI